MLATLTHETFSKPGWIFERKLDGERCLVFRNRNRIRLLSRNKKNLNKTYPDLVDALKKQEKQQFVADGEIVAFQGKITSFSRLQKRIQIKSAEKARASGVSVYFYLFDLLYSDGYDLRRLALRERKQRLKKGLNFGGKLRLTKHRNETGKKYFQEACDKGWEGLIAKDASAPYVGKRSKAWLKFKCENGQEFVIGGYTEPQGSRVGFGALLLGYYQGKKFKYAGKVGTGFDDDFLKGLAKKLAKLEQDSSPFADCQKKSKGVHWVSPSLVGEVSFTEWTRAGRLRHPRFLGLRRDKNPKDVVRENKS